jgi:hypothetical protein
MPGESDANSLSRLVDDDVAWKALMAQVDAAHARIQALLALPPHDAPTDIHEQLQKARADLNDAEQALLAMVAVKRAQERQKNALDSPGRWT